MARSGWPRTARTRSRWTRVSKVSSATSRRCARPGRDEEERPRCRKRDRLRHSNDARMKVRDRDRHPYDQVSLPTRRSTMKTIETTIPHPPTVSTEEWRAERVKLLGHEKRLTHQRDRVNAERRRLPMVKIEKDYRFQGPKGKVRLADLFEGKRQLVVYHFMFDPKWDKGCPGCTGYVDSLGDLGLLRQRDTNFVLVSRAPLP